MNLKVIKTDVKPLVPTPMSLVIVGNKAYVYDINNVETELISGDNIEIPVGTESQVLGYDENGKLIPITSKWVPDGGTATTYLSGDNTWKTPTNTTYSVITETEFNTGTANTARAISASSLNRDITKKIQDVIPIAPTTGNFTLTSVDGVISWIENV